MRKQNPGAERARSRIPKKIGAGEAARRNEDGDEKAVRDERGKEERNPKAKLPKLAISKFEGTALDWFRFWNQFETEIDQQDHISPVTKYSYLKEFLLPHVRKLVDSLPFTSEGYSRVKAILQAKFGKPTAVANTHVNCIISLPIVFGSHPNKVHDFYEKLMPSVQALETMRKLMK